MKNQMWAKPVVVETRKTGERIGIGSTEHASKFMLNEWPTLEDGQAFRAAKQAMLDAVEGKIDSERARQAFLAALEEGDVYVFEK
ncbi:DUF982 domain-containing protein [Rhizobium sp. RCC_161_2]|uniref:DUF982 domain-containing protein n=1 Tax=Rhizobium sp. RCC_161_2 TaxID=3239219 RepID=UPI00352360B5